MRDFETGSDASLEKLLDRSEVWRGRNHDGAHTSTIPAGFEALDAYLPGGGWPVDGLTEILLDHYGIGELSLLMPALATLSQQAAAKQRWIVWVGPPFVPYAPALSRYGIDVGCILLVHPSDTRHDALWATEQVIRSGSSAAVLAWIEQADMTALRRLQLGTEACRCWTVLFRPVTVAGQPTPARLRLALSAAYSSDSSGGEGAASVHGGTSRSGFTGARIDVLKCMGRRPESLWVDDVILRSMQDIRDGGPWRL